MSHTRSQVDELPHQIAAGWQLRSVGGEVHEDKPSFLMVNGELLLVKLGVIDRFLGCWFLGKLVGNAFFLHKQAYKATGMNHKALMSCFGISTNTLISS